MLLRRYLQHIILTLALMLGIGMQSHEQPMPLPVKDQMPLFLKILSYDKNLPERGDEIVIGVVYQERYRNSLLAKDELVAVMKPYRTVSGRPVRLVPLAIDEKTSLADVLDDPRINVFYVSPLRAVDMEQITTVSRDHEIVTLTGVPSYLEAGLSVSLDVKGGKPQILINLPASEAEGADFHSQLLKVARVIR